MKKVTLLTRTRSAALLLAISFSLTLSAQKSKSGNDRLPAFGKVEKADLEMKKCEFDDKADAMILLDEGNLDAILGSPSEYKRRIRIKILNSKGLEWANVRLPYISQQNSQKISGLEAQTYNLDASGNVVVTEIDKKLIYDKKINKYVSEKVFTFPEVKVGSIIEYKYKHTGVGLVDWYFQRSIPVRYSQFSLDFPQEIEVSVIPTCGHPYESKVDNKSTRTVKTYSMAQVPASRDERYVINEDYYRDRLEAKVVAYNFDGKRDSRIVNWVQVVKHLAEEEDFGMQLKKNIPRTADLDQQLKNVVNPYDRMKTIYKYVQDNMKWNDYTGIWALDGVKSAWKDKKGTVGEINLILVNLLRDAGLDAHPVLVSSHDNGIVNTLDAGTYESPGYRQFDKAMAYVEINKTIYVLDATQKNIPAHLFPTDVLMTQGLVIDKLETWDWGWKDIWKESLSYKNDVVIRCNIDPEGNLNGEASIYSADYARLARIETARTGKEKFLEKFITEHNPGMTVEEVSFVNIDSDSLPLIQKLKFTQPMKSAGEYKYFSVNMLSGLEENPFIPEKRNADVFFGYKQNFSINGSFILPEGFEFETLPKNIKMIMPDTSIVISRVSQVTNNNLLQTRLVLEFRKPYYAAAQYEMLQEFYLQLFELLNEQFVVRKKAQP